MYYSHPNFNELNGLGQFKDLKMDTSTDKLSIYEIWSLNDGMPDTDNYTPLDYNDYEVVFPKEVHEIVYLIIPKKELPNSMHINGEVKLRKGISKANNLTMPEEVGAILLLLIFEIMVYNITTFIFLGI